MLKHLNLRHLLSRRGFLGSLGLGGAALAAGHLLPRRARAEITSTADAPFVIYATFRGGWDQLLALDPRDNLAYTGSNPIVPAYDQLAASDAEIGKVLSATGNTGVVKPAGSNITFGPAVGKLSDRFADLCVLRGVDMGTLTHEVGRRYFLTGKFPRGLAANGSSFTTWSCAATGDVGFEIPNLVVGMESYNEGLPTFATGLRVQKSDDLRFVMAAIGEPLPAAAVGAVDDYMWAEKCSDELLDQDGLVTRFLDSREKAQILASGELAALFEFSQSPSHPSVTALYEAFGIATAGGSNQFAQEIAGPKGQAALAAQAITNEVSQSVSIKLSSNIDHHDDDYQTDHSPALRGGFEALADLIDYLKASKVPNDPEGRSFYDRTVIVVSSDFARTPRVNARQGRDHHLASSVLVAGAGIRGNTVIGATSDDTFGSQPVDLSTGDVSQSGVVLRPPDIHATVLEAVGLPWDHISNQEPQIIEAMLEG